MQFREVTYNQQLQMQRLVHGPEADITERSLPNMPGSAMREILKHSQHPQNLEQIMLTLRRPANSITRRRFAEVGGELILIQKVTSSEPVVSDFKIAHFGQVMDLPEGMLYPAKSHTTLFETWLRVEMLDALRMMIEENLVRSLLPEMQLKLISDMLQMSEDTEQPELVRLYSFAVAVAGVKRFHAARAAAVAGGFPAKTAAFLAAVLDGPHAEDSIFLRDPCEQLKALATAAEGMYLVAICNKQGDYALATSSSSAGSIQDGSSTETVDPAAAVAAAVAAGATLEALARSMEGLAVLQDSCAGPLLSKALEKLWKLLQDREGFVYTVPAALAKHKAAAEASAAATAESNGDSSSSKAENGGNTAQEDGESAESAQEEETEEQKKLRAAAEEAIAMSDVTFDENWHMYLKAVYDTQLVPIYAAVGMQLVAALLQLLVQKEGADKVTLPPKDVLQQMSAYTKHPVLPVSASILAAMAAAAPAAAGSSGSSAAIVSLPGHVDIEYSALAKSCCCCNKHEEMEVKMLRCGQCGCSYYCSANCQKADWKLGHKAVCKELGQWRAKAQEAAAASNGNSSNGNSN